MAMHLSKDTKNILGLQLPTDPRWVNLAEISLEAILTDHAYCEQKAATSCISLIQKNSDKEKLVVDLAPVVTEEWGHFRLVLQGLQKRRLKLGKQSKDEYVNALMNFQTKGGHPDDRFLDQLLMMAMIEARSCERFKRLSEGLLTPILQNSTGALWKVRRGITLCLLNLPKHIYQKKKFVAGGIYGSHTR